MVRLKLLGGLAAHADDRILDAEHHRRALVLLAIVAAAPGGISRDKLLAFFWPDSDMERARNALRQRLFALRRDLGTEELFIGTTELRLNPTAITSDLAEFEAALASGNPERAAELYDGPLLDGVYIKDAPELEQWVESQRNRLAARAAQALKSASAAASERGARDQAARWMRRLVQLDPTNAEATLGLLTALDDAGDRAGALQQARVYTTLMRTEYETEPDARINALAERMRSGERSVAPVNARGEKHGATVTPVEQGTVVAISRPRASRSRLVIALGTVALLIVAATVLLMPGKESSAIVLSSTTQITNTPGLDLDPALSPDGRFLAYAAGISGRTRIYVRHIAGGRTVQISGDVPGEHRWPSWSPDGTRIVFMAGGQLFLVPALGGAPQLLSDDVTRYASPAWSPDGMRVAFSMVDSVVIATMGENVTLQSFSTPPATHSLAWDPDGRRLALVSQNGDYVFGGVGGMLLGNLAPTSVWTLSLDDGRRERVTPPGHLYASPVWTADGSAILYVSNVAGVRDVFQHGIDARGRPRGTPVRLTTGLNAHGINLSRDGTRLAYSVFRTRSNIFAAPITLAGVTPSSAIQAITNENQTVEAVAVSADGKWLAFDSDRTGAGNIYKMPASGGEAIQLTRDSSGSFVPQWSRDGTQIAFHSWRNGNRDVFVMNADGGAVAQVTSDPRHDYYADWAPDGRRLVFRRPDNAAVPASAPSKGKIGMMLTTRGEDGRWSEASPVVAKNVSSAFWTHDGRYLAYLDGNTLMLRDARSGTARILWSTDGVETLLRPAVGPDTSIVYLRTRDTAGVNFFYSIPVAGGRPRVLLRVDDPSRRMRAEYATDGRRLYFTMAETESDIWVMEVRRP